MLPGQCQGHVEQQLEPLQDFSSQGSPGKLTREENKIKNALNVFVFVCVHLFIFLWFCLSLGGFSIVILLVSILEITHCIIILVRAPE